MRERASQRARHGGGGRGRSPGGPTATAAEDRFDHRAPAGAGWRSVAMAAFVIVVTALVALILAQSAGAIHVGFLG